MLMHQVHYYYKNQMAQPQNLMKSVYQQRLYAMIPNLLKWFDQKQKKLDEITQVTKDILTSLEKCTSITLRQLGFIVMFLKEEKEATGKVIDSAQTNSLLKTFEKHKSKKSKPQQKDKNLVDIEEWNPSLYQYFDTLAQANLQHKVSLKKMESALQNVHQQFENEQDTYKSFLKKSFKNIHKKLQEIEQNSKDQRKLVVKYHQTLTKRQQRQTLVVMSELKTLQSMTVKQISIVVSRLHQIKEFFDKVINQERRLAQTFKQNFTKYMKSYEELYRLSNNFMSLGKIMEKFTQQQDIVKKRYLQKYLLPAETKKSILNIIAVEAKDDTNLVSIFLKVTQNDILQLVELKKNINHLLDQIVFRKWELELAEGWLIQSWTKCQGCIGLDGHLVLYGQDGKQLKVINAKTSKMNKRQQTTAFLTEDVKGFFSNSTNEYKLRFGSPDELEEFDLYIANQIK